MDLRIIQVARHRNGVGGEPFYAILFRDLEENPGNLMVATVFEESGAVAVLDVDLLKTEVGTEFGHNSWRGDWYEPELREAIKRYENDREREWQRMVRTNA